MKRRVLSIGALLAVFGLILIVAQGTNAVNQGNTPRYKTVEIDSVQYVWELVSNVDGQVICQIVIDHPNRPTIEETLTICAEQIFPAEATATPQSGDQPSPEETPAPFDLAEYFQTVSYRFVTTRQLVRTIQVPAPAMIVNLIVPPVQGNQTFVSVYAYEPVPGETIQEIRGILNGWQFTCPSARCDLPITADSILEFWATSSFGDESTHTQATLRVLRENQGNRIEISSLVPIVLYQDACSNIWGLPNYQLPTWANLPPLPDDLNTMKPYQYLAGQLIQSGVVNAQDCPGGGLTSSGAPNACGLERASQPVIDWQNQFDVGIWAAGRDIGIPPVILKTLIEQESQFWPGNSIRAFYEYGLGQLSPVGADVALRWDNELYATVCSTVFYDCSYSYGRLPSNAQALMRGGLMNVFNSECATCPHGIDLVKAQESIPVLARTLRSNCYQVNYLLDINGLSAGYEDLWRMTLVSYHSGYQCLNSALVTLKYNKLEPVWDNLEGLLTCPGSQFYVNEFTSSLNQFDANRLPHPERETMTSKPIFVPTATPTVGPTPTITPTVVRSMAHIRVMVYVDTNGNQYPEESEKVNDILVQAQFQDGTVMNDQTERGEVIFDLTGRPVGEDMIIALPDLYRTQKVRVIQDGEIPVVFRLEEPVVPPVLP